MANIKEIKTRMNSVRDTQKITNAMYLIASTKMRKAKEDLDKTRPYFTALQNEIKRIFRTAGDVESRYFYPADGSHMSEGTYGCLVITADKGLAGAYNQNVIKEAQKILEEHTGGSSTVSIRYRFPVVSCIRRRTRQWTARGRSVRFCWISTIGERSRSSLLSIRI